MSAASLEDARRVKQRAFEIASRAASVTGVGLTRVAGSYAVKVNLSDRVPPDLPTEIEGVPIVYEQTGPIRLRRGG
jgi:hypothetical protein